MKPLRLFGTAMTLGLSLGCSAAPEELTETNDQAVTTLTFDAARSYEERARLLERLQVDHPLPAGMLDPRDGIILQTRWQGTTRDGSAGPDVIHAGTGTNRVLYGWWPNVNYTLTAWQMIALQERRAEYRNVQVTGYANIRERCIDGARFDTKSAPARHVVDTIVDFYRTVDETTARSRNGTLDETARSVAEADLQTKMWRFHEAALEFALARNTDVLGTTRRAQGCDSFGTVLPEGERQFAKGWGTSLVPLLAAVNFSTAKSIVGPVNNYVLPQSVVTTADLDLVNGRSTMAPSQRAGVAFIVKIDDIESKNDGPIRELLEGAGANESFRAQSTRFQGELVKLLDGLAAAFSNVRSGDGRGQGEGCILDAQCRAGFYCRNDWSFAFVCLPPGNVGEHCWTSEQCADGLSCHWIAAHLQKEGPWHAKLPHPARVCNAHTNAPHEHQPR